MATNLSPNTSSAPPNPNDLPPPYAAVVGNPQYGFVAPPGEPFPPAEGAFVQPKQFTAPGVYPHPVVANVPTQAGDIPPPPGISVPVGVVMPPAVGSEPTTITCYNCGKVVTTRVTYTTAWHTHLVAGSICVITMVCSLCCLGLVPYCFDAFKDAEHYCPNCSTFIGKNNKYIVECIQMSNQGMDTARTDREMAQLGVDMETIQHRDPPPPYTMVDRTIQGPVTVQPVHQTIIVQQSIKNEPVYLNCPSCHKRTLSSVQFVSSHKTHMLAGFICGLTFWCMLCCLAVIPYAFSTFKKADHYCSNCNYYLGSYSKL